MSYITRDELLAALERAHLRYRDHEQGLPACVREWRALKSEGHMTRLVVTRLDGRGEASWTAVQCLEWLATAPAREVARLALQGDALAALRALWLRRHPGDAPPLSDECELALTELAHAEVYDVDELVPLLRTAIDWANAHEESELGPGQRRLWRAIVALPPEWRALVEEENNG